MLRDRGAAEDVVQATLLRPFRRQQHAQAPVTIGCYQGMIGTVTWQGGDMTYDGISIPDATTQSELTLRVPAPGGQVEDLVFAAEGLSHQQLASIVSSGLSSPNTKR